jgi:hypothetical protein
MPIGHIERTPSKLGNLPLRIPIFEDAQMRVWIVDRPIELRGSE